MSVKHYEQHISYILNCGKECYANLVANDVRRMNNDGFNAMADEEY
ncbi:hypothetical protein T4C_13857 [Trichinella pseudospiralis]|uniref:Uncharacterized protein n=1 Tax=Trichinella pseudospiralis TaxID=6337 RepID=A0A0V1GKJ4_TRIPS|nr:hypothetical protein T4C_13857 [Trichinella pseudospiralis]